MCTATLLVDPFAATDADIYASGEAALHAGFGEASVWAHHIPALAGLDLHIEVVEAAMEWAGGTPAEAAAEADRFAQLAQAVGASKIVAVTMDPARPDLGRARENLALVVAAATAVGAQVCVEFLPWSGIPDLATAWELVEPLGAGAGILLASPAIGSAMSSCATPPPTRGTTSWPKPWASVSYPATVWSTSEGCSDSSRRSVPTPSSPPRSSTPGLSGTGGVSRRLARCRRLPDRFSTCLRADQPEQPSSWSGLQSRQYLLDIEGETLPALVDRHATDERVQCEGRRRSGFVGPGDTFVGGQLA
jgi:hypothetical protein